MSTLLVFRPTRKWSTVLLAFLAVAALALLPTQVGSSVNASNARNQSKPTIVLVHGAWADGSSWTGVVSRLQDEGFTVIAEANPLRGLLSDSAYLAAILATISGPLVLVGHSYGGAVITNAATGNSNVKALVYVDAFIPDQGETVLKLNVAQPGSCLGGDPTQVFNFVKFPGAPNGDFDLYVKPALFPNCFANGIPSDEAAVLASEQRPLTLSAGSTPSGTPAWKTIPSWSVIGTLDNVLPLAEQRIMSQRANAHITEIPAGHLSMISQPQTVTRVIEQAAGDNE
jgi:pimeloyl-ACP methyl ester carboxylesterase